MHSAPIWLSGQNTQTYWQRKSGRACNIKGLRVTGGVAFIAALQLFCLNLPIEALQFITQKNKRRLQSSVTNSIWTALEHYEGSDPFRSVPFWVSRFQLPQAQEISSIVGLILPVMGFVPHSIRNCDVTDIHTQKHPSVDGLTLGLVEG